MSFPFWDHSRRLSCSGTTASQRERSGYLQITAEHIFLKSVVERPDGSLGAIGGVNFAQHVLEMNLDGRLGDVEGLGNDLIAVALEQAAHDLGFALR